MALRGWSEVVREDQDIYGFLQQRSGSRDIKSLLLIKEIRYLKLKNVALFCVWEDARVWAP